LGPYFETEVNVGGVSAYVIWKKKYEKEEGRKVKMLKAKGRKSRDRGKIKFKG
jgi:hypothetical protein